ncbi:hypothetical protein M5K25_002000 [Dendrobium thyrsiflorum]|uniref:Reverse transcriptase zinc-binding domain-containing protein n=1 Tax=Dendrobium thyrsiflorum TaxID=117978 RepID=A0ABD0VRS8_DENTH
MRTRLTYARVCVLVDCEATYPDEIMVSLDGDLVHLKVQYEWRTSPCAHCKSLVHSSNLCPLRPETQQTSPVKPINKPNRGRSSSRNPRARILSSSTPAPPQSKPMAPTPNTTQLQNASPSDKNISQPQARPIPSSLKTNISPHPNAIGLPLHFQPHSPTTQNRDPANSDPQVAFKPPDNIATLDNNVLPNLNSPTEESSSSNCDAPILPDSTATCIISPNKFDLLQSQVEPNFLDGASTFTDAVKITKHKGTAVQPATLSVMDLQSVGCPFTWFNNRLDNPIHIKLDRALAPHALTTAQLLFNRGRRLSLATVSFLKTSERVWIVTEIGMSHKLHMIAWGKVCLPKSCGGLGLLSPQAIQFGFNCSLICRLYNTNSPLSRWLLMRYTSPWRPPTVNASKFWRAICTTALTAKPHFKFRITPYASIAFFWDHWSFVDSLADYINGNLDASVGDFISDNNWALPSGLDPCVDNSIKAIPICVDAKACLLWDNNELGYFGAFVQAFHGDVSTCPWANYLWFKGCALRFSAFGWICMVGGLKTADALSRRNIHINPICPLCRSDYESSNHLFFECQFSYNILLKLIPQASILLLRPNVLQFFVWLEDLNLNADILRLYKLVTCCTIYLIWKERNDRRFGGNSKCWTTVLKSIQHYVCAKVFKWKHGFDLLDRI